MNEVYRAHVAEVQSRWEAAMEAEGFDAVLVHSGAPLVRFLDDFEYPFRPNPHFLAWLPLTRHAHSVLLIRFGERPLLWYFQPEDYWHLPPADPEAWWADAFEVRIVGDRDRWREELPRSVSRPAFIGDAPEFVSGRPADSVNPEPLLTRLHLARTRKTAWEIECMRQANRRAAAGHVAAADAFRAGSPEFDIHHAYLAAAGQTDDELPYASIVALNGHGAVLHYQGRDRSPPREAHSFLIDAGAAEFGYAADITRTWAARDGAFADLIRALDTVQQRLCDGIRPGVDYRELHLEAHLRLAGMLRDAGVIRPDPEAAVASGLSAVFYPHGLGHFIGLQTHDVAGLIDNDGKALPRPEGHPFLRLTRRLEPGNVLTVEPGVYFIGSLLRRWKETSDASAIDWKAVERFSPCGGIRIEDDVVVTGQGCENLTRPAFAALPV